MIRGTPSRVELKPSDMAEYEAARAGWMARASSDAVPEGSGKKDQQLARIGLAKKTK